MSCNDETIPRIQIKKRKRNEINKNGDLIYKNKYFLVKIIGWNVILFQKE